MRYSAESPLYKIVEQNLENLPKTAPTVDVSRQISTWPKIIKHYIKHLFKIDTDHIESLTLPILNRLYCAGLISHELNNKPFPIRRCVAVVPVSDDDPRGNKKYENEN